MHQNLDQWKLPELKAITLRDLNIPVAAIRTHGDLRLRSTWISAIASTQSQSATESAGTTPVSEVAVETAIAQEQSDFVSSSEHLVNLTRSCDCTEKPAIAHSKTPNCIKLVTSGQFDQKLKTCYQTDELKLIDGQLLTCIPLAKARSVASLAESGRWADALLLVRDNQRATRILERIRGMR